MPAPRASDRVLAILAAKAGPDGAASVSKQVLARELRVTPSTVHIAVRELIAAGRLRRQPQLAPHGGMLANQYVLVGR